MNRDLASLARHINADHARAERAKTDWYQYARRAGERLIGVKRRVGHGQFMQWVKKNCSCAYASANLYMRVAEHWDEANFERVQSLRQAKKHLQTRHREPSPDEPPRRVADDLLTLQRQYLAALKRAQGMPERLQQVSKVVAQRSAEIQEEQERLKRLLGNQAAA